MFQHARAVTQSRFLRRLALRTHSRDGLWGRSVCVISPRRKGVIGTVRLSHRPVFPIAAPASTGAAVTEEMDLRTGDKGESNGYATSAPPSKIARQLL
eukprot:285398-Prorocentrum_minimum.AAC.1